jgi:hypothetical protein
MRIRGITRRFADVCHDRCLVCGERIFGIEASRLFDAAFARHRRSRAA